MDLVCHESSIDCWSGSQAWVKKYISSFLCKIRMVAGVFGLHFAYNMVCKWFCVGLVQSVRNLSEHDYLALLIVTPFCHCIFVSFMRIVLLS